VGMQFKGVNWMAISEQEKAILKEEILAELKEQLAVGSATKENNFALKPTMDKWINGKAEGFDHRHKQRNGPLRNAYKSGVEAYKTWDQVRALTCRVMGVSYVRQIEDQELANEFADELCRLIVDYRKKVNDEAHT